MLVNNAGIATGAPLARTTLDDWRAHLDVNATGAFLCTRAVARRHDRARRWPHRHRRVDRRALGARYTAAYTASKHAAVGLMRAIAAEVAGTGVTANAVCPAWVRTEMMRRAVERIAATTGRARGAGRGGARRREPLGRPLEPEEVAVAVAFLASPEAAAINGQTLVLDGGGIQA